MGIVGAWGPAFQSSRFCLELEAPELRYFSPGTVLSLSGSRHFLIILVATEETAFLDAILAGGVNHRELESESWTWVWGTC